MSNINSNIFSKCCCLFIVILLFVMIYGFLVEYRYKKFYIDEFSNNLKRVKVGSNSYRVQEHLDNPHTAAELMDRLNEKAQLIIKHLESTFIKNGGVNIKPEYKDRVITGIKNLKKNFDPNNLIENLPDTFDKDTSYVIDKGEVFAICLRDVKNNNSLSIDMNEMVFVLVHEMSHLFTISYGHEFEFWANFRFILNEAVKLGLHVPINYKMQKKPYCGNNITYSPLYDYELPDYLIQGNFK